MSTSRQRVYPLPLALPRPTYRGRASISVSVSRCEMQRFHCFCTVLQLVCGISGSQPLWDNGTTAEIDALPQHIKASYLAWSWWFGVHRYNPLRPVAERHRNKGGYVSISGYKHGKGLNEGLRSRRERVQALGDG